ncbi:MAG: AraC family transcriptional regulator [Agriterribacter sp.]
MKPRQEKLILDLIYSFVVQKDVYPYYPTPWHYHPEYELVLVLKSTGQRTVGDSVERFSDGDLVFLGPNLPHAYQNDPVYYQKNSKLTAEAIVIHFKEDFLGKDFFNLPEMIYVNQLFDKARLGVKVLGDTRDKIADMMQEMHASTGHRRIILLLSIFEMLSVSNETRLLANSGFVQQSAVSADDRLAKVHEYIMENFKKDISLVDAAKVANMSVPSFCRFFKACTRKGFSTFLNEVRIGYARKLLLEDRYNIAQNCYESGFKNMSNFNRQFKKYTGESPSHYKQRVSQSINAAQYDN